MDETLDDPIFAAFVECATKCEEIAVEILPSYSTQYADVDAMIRMPSSVLACSFAHQLAFMQGKLKNLEKMRSDLRSPSESAAPQLATQRPKRPVLDGASAAGGATQDLSCKEPVVKKTKTYASKSIKIKTDTLDRIKTQSQEQRLAAVAEHMNDIDALPLILAKGDKARLRQRTYLAFALYAIKTAGAPLLACAISEAFAYQSRKFNYSVLHFAHVRSR